LTSSTKYSLLSDDDLVLRYRAGGDNQWLGYLLERYTTLLLGVAIKYLKDKTLAEDAVQQVFIKVLTAFPKDQILNFKGWLYILMRNHCLQQLRSKPHFSDESLLMNVQHEEDNTEETDWFNRAIEHMDEAIAMLSHDQQAAITLFYLKKYSYEQIITETGFTFMQVKSHIQNGKRNLKVILLKKSGDNRP
jgi:RNA polymerase sigma factor (sigma-70 family)